MPVFQYQPLAETLLPPELPPLPWLSGGPDEPPPIRAKTQQPEPFTRIEPAAPPPDFWGTHDAPLIPFPRHLPESEPTAILLPLLTLPSRWSPYGPTFAIRERGTGTYRAQLVAGDGVTPLPGTVLQTLLLTLYTISQTDAVTVVNGRDRQNVLNQNNVSISTGGLVTWQIQPGDTALVDATVPFERHIALLEWTWARGAGKKEVIFVVRNLRRIP